MFKRGNKEFVLDMLLACENILKYTKGMRFEEFEKDGKTKDAVIRNIEILGEAVKNISTEFRKDYRDIEWNDIARTRDKFIHFYFGIDDEILWDIITIDIPKLKQKLEEIVKQRGWENET
jgi:uncharacterized protein with HEPN domain